MLSLGFGRSARSLNQKGNSLYKKGMYADALSSYKQAQAIEPQNMVFDYNIGCAYYKGDSLKGAGDSFLKIISSCEDEDIKEKAYYNIGNTLFRGSELDAAIEAYKQALRLNPEDTDAKINLELALKAKEEQKQEGEGESKEGEEKSKEGKEKEEEQEQKFTEEESRALLNAIEEEEKKAKQKSQKATKGKIGILRDW